MSNTPHEGTRALCIHIPASLYNRLDSMSRELRLTKTEIVSRGLSHELHEAGYNPSEEAAK